ncbi:DNA primase [Nanobdella aerobiophila]|uniref:DNA primase DnaG n=1 Tax=Nanobdella aerobiophila TaxID=2586965 RepID=A0A915S9S5_9ARCH|nr:DNA primase DnaG [Nanobdella aerobiophila]BBL45232.1 DNA primase [Nanobdella aerobiophila]
MAKISPPYIKYVIHASVYIDGVVEKPDVIGAVFGQTEGLLGSEMDLRELQRSGKIGRIEVDLKIENDKTVGEIKIPTSLNRFETTLIAATLETVTRIGPTHASIKIQKIEDVRKTKVQHILERARDLLTRLINEELPDPKELLLYLEYSQNIKTLTNYGNEKLPAGPDIDRSEEIILVEGRADVLNLLRYGITNVVALNGLNVPKTVIELSKKKIVTTFFDGDRGGDLLVKECMINGVDIDFIAKPEPGKEVEELSRKEIMKSLKNRISFDQIKAYYEKLEGSIEEIKNIREEKKIKDPILQKLKSYMEDIFRTDQALLLDDNFNTINKIPVDKLDEMIFKNSNISYITMDGVLTRELLEKIERNTNVKYIICIDSIQKNSNKVKIYTLSDLDRV